MEVPYLIDPPEEQWRYYSQSFIKKIFGRKVLYIFTIALGLLFIFVGVSGLVMYGG